MNNQTINNVKKISKATLIVTLINVFVAILMTLSWFLPIFSIDGETYGLLDIMADDMSSFFTDEGGKDFLILIAIYAVTIVWAAFPKMWAGIVGTIYEIPLILVTSLFYYVIHDPDYINPDSGILPGSFNFKFYASILLLILSVVKLVFTIKDKKKA